jgi:tetratricopeptide (TPR) repeat protein
LGEKIQEARPGEPETLPYFLDLLVQTGRRAAAIEALQNALANEEMILPEKDVIRVIAIARNHHLGLEEACFEYTEKHHGISPELVYARGLHLATSDAERGLAYVASMFEQVETKNLKWSLLWARFLDAINDPRAGEAWITLADKMPDNIGLQQMAVASNSVQNNLEFIQRATDRILSNTSVDSTTGRVAQAKLRLRDASLTAQEAKDIAQDLREVVSRSPRLVEPRYLLSRALLKSGDMSGAMEELKVISRLQPKNAMVALEMAKLSANQRNFEQARVLLEQVLQLGTISDVQKLEIATIYSRMGNHAEGILLLDPIVAASPQNASASLLLAHMNIQTGQLSKAADIYQRLMADPTPEAVQAYALFLGVIGRVSEAEQVLEKLDSFDLEPGVKELVIANFYGRFPASDKAVQSFQAAIEAAPDKAGPRLSLVNYYLIQNQIEEMLKVNQAALQADVENKEVFELLNTHADMIRKVGTSTLLKPFIASMISDAVNRDAAVDVLGVILDSVDDNDRLIFNVELLNRIKPLSDKYTRFLTLQKQLTDWYMKLGMYEDAVQLSTRTKQAYPTLSDPAEQLVRALAAQKKWSDVELMAQEWKERTLSNPIRANISIGEAMINLDRPKEALEVIEPYVSIALAAPAQFPEVITLHCRASVAAGDVDRAELVLKPLIAQASGWRTLWLSIAVFMIEDQERAAAWLERVEPVLDPNSPIERVTLANDWFRVGNRFDNNGYRQRGLDMLDAMATAENATPDLMVANAVLHYAASENAEGEAKDKLLSKVENDYRRSLPLLQASLETEESAIKRQAVMNQMSIVQNNLSILLADTGGDLGEALKYAKDALENNPNHANFYDTVAHIHLARKEYDQAQVNLEQALSLQPGSIEWRVNLADIFIVKNDLDKAANLLFEIDNLRVGNDSLPDKTLARIDTLRDNIDIGREKQAASIIE